MELLEIVKKLIQAPGVSGYEAPIRETIKKILAQYGTPEEDAIGNLYLSIGVGEKIALISHMDEIGMVVSHIEDNGYLHIRKIGGVDARYLYGRVVEIFTDSGKAITGVIGLKPVHLSSSEDLKKIIPIEELLIDIGVTSKKAVLDMGIRVLDPVRWKKDFFTMNENYVIARGLDDRIGCAVLLLLLERLSHEKLSKQVTFIFSIQEETGLRGAKTLIKMPFTEVYAIDTVSAGDIPNLPLHISPVKTGHGPAIRFIDSRGVGSQLLRKKIKIVAKKENISIQEVYGLGSTDAAAIFELGIKAIALCVPVKYTHSPVEAVHIADVKNLVLLLEKLITS